MKSLISSTLILLALYAQATCADEQLTRFVVLTSSHQTDSGQYTSIKPTLLVPWQDSQSGFVLFRSLNREQTINYSGIKQNHNSQTYGFGMHHRVNGWMYTQVVVQSQQYSQQNGFESMFNLSMSF